MINELVENIQNKLCKYFDMPIEIIKVKVKNKDFSTERLHEELIRCVPEFEQIKEEVTKIIFERFPHLNADYLCYFFIQEKLPTVIINYNDSFGKYFINYLNRSISNFCNDQSEWDNSKHNIKSLNVILEKGLENKILKGFEHSAFPINHDEYIVFIDEMDKDIRTIIKYLDEKYIGNNITREIENKLVYHCKTILEKLYYKGNIKDKECFIFIKDCCGKKLTEAVIIIEKKYSDFFNVDNVEYMKNIKDKIQKYNINEFLFLENIDITNQNDRDYINSLNKDVKNIIKRYQDEIYEDQSI